MRVMLRTCVLVSLSSLVGVLLLISSGLLVELGRLLSDLMILIALISVDMDLLLVNCVGLLLEDLWLGLIRRRSVRRFRVGGFHLLLLPHVRIKLGLVGISLRELRVKVPLRMAILSLLMVLFHFSELICNFKL